MPKAKPITEMIAELQRENEALQGLRKLFNKACKDEFGYEPIRIKEMLKRCETYDAKMKARPANAGVSNEVKA